MTVGPPRLAEWLLRLLLVPSDREWVLGDLHEDHARRVAEEGRRTAVRRYWREVFRSVGPSVRARLASRVRSWWPPRFRAPGVELRHAARSLRRRPTLLAGATLTLAVGIGAATAIFTVVDVVLLRPLPYPASDRLVMVWNVYESWRDHVVLGTYWETVELSYPEYERIRDGAESLESVGIYATTSLALAGAGEAQQVVAGVVSSTLFPLLGVEPVLGRVFGAGETGPGAERVVVLSHTLWRGRFGSDPGVLGRVVELDGVPYDVIGVLPPGFRVRSLSVWGGPKGRHDVWLPVGAAGSPLTEDNHAYEAVARMAPGVTPAQVAADIGGLAGESRRWPTRVVMRQEQEVGHAAAGLAVLLAAVVVLMLIACGNVAALLLGELAGRLRDLSTRAALGASHGTLLRQLLLESGLLGLLGAMAGFAVSFLLVPVLLRLAPPELPVPEALVPDIRVFLVTASAGVVFGVVFGLVPGLVLGRTNLVDGLRARAGASGPAGRGVQRAVVAGQLALAVVLVVATGLLVRSLRAELAVDPGFRAEGLLTGRVALPEARYPDRVSTLAFVERAMERLEGIPGVTAATVTSGLPFSGIGGSSSFDVVGRETPREQKKPEADRRSVRPGFHETLGIPLLRGRLLEPRDDAGPPVVLVSKALVRQYFPAGDALGSRILRDHTEWEIVGVVGDLLHDDLAGQPRPTFYLPLGRSEDPRRLAFVLRTGLPAEQSARALRESVWSLDDTLPVEDVATMRTLVARSTRAERYRAFLVALFAASALLLAGVGVFGVTARSVALCAREMGVRMALGAKRPGLVRLAVAREATPLAIGFLLGIAGAVAAAGLLRSFLFQVSAYDLTTFVGAAGLIAACGLLASYVAARRISRLQPMQVMRAE